MASEVYDGIHDTDGPLVLAAGFVANAICAAIRLGDRLCTANQQSTKPHGREHGALSSAAYLVVDIAKAAVVSTGEVVVEFVSNTGDRALEAIGGLVRPGR